MLNKLHNIFVGKFQWQWQANRIIRETKKRCGTKIYEKKLWDFFSKIFN